MKSSSLVSTFLFAGQLVLAAPRPAPKEASTGLQDGPLQHGGYHRVEKRKKLCSKLTSIDDSKPELAKLQWDESGAGDIGDDFIDANGAENWVRRLDEQIFDKQGNSPFHCLSWGGGCDYVKDCMTYADAGNNAAYYLYSSVTSAYTYLSAMHEELQSKGISSGFELSQVFSDFKFEEEDALGNFFDIMGTAFGLVGNVAKPVSELSGIIGSLTDLQSQLDKPDEPDEDEWLAKMNKYAQGHFDALDDKLGKIRDALFGKKGTSTDHIPDEMQTQSYKSPIIKAFGDGKWLVENPGQNANETMKEAKRIMKKGLAWQMIKVSQQGFVFADAGKSSKDKCEDDDTEDVWDPKEELCFKLYRINDHRMERMPKTITDKLFANDGDYNLDRLKTYRNAYACWVDNDGKLDDVKIGTDMEPNVPPSCFYGIMVVKGVTRDNYIRLSKFPNQKKGEHWNDGPVFKPPPIRK